VVGLALIVAMVGTVTLALRANSGFSVGAHTQTRLAFTDVGPLLRGDEVRMNSLRVGRVTHIDLDQDHNRALVTIDIEGRYPLYRDAHAELKSRSGLGTKFVDIQPGTPAAGAIGDEVSTRGTPTRRRSWTACSTASTPAPGRRSLPGYAT